jgi:hypothetical protein
MTHVRAKHVPGIPGKAIQPVANARPATPASHEKRRGERLNSRVPISVEWSAAGGQLLRKEAQTRVIGPYGCMAIVPMNLEVKQSIQLTNMVSRQSNAAVVVWRGKQQPEGWEMGIELLNPQMGFWEIEL